MSWDNSKDCCCDGTNNQLIVRTIPVCVSGSELVFADMSQVQVTETLHPVSNTVIGITFDKVIIQGIEGTIEYFVEDPDNGSTNLNYSVNNGAFTSLQIDGIQCPAQVTGDWWLGINGTVQGPVSGDNKIIVRTTFDDPIYSKRFHYVDLNNGIISGRWSVGGVYPVEAICGGPLFYVDPVTRQVGPDGTGGSDPYVCCDGTLLFNNGSAISSVEFHYNLNPGGGTTTTRVFGLRWAISGNSEGCSEDTCPIDFSIGYLYNDVLYTSSDDLVSDVQAAFPQYVVSFNSALCRLDLLYTGPDPEPELPVVIDLTPPVEVDRPIANDDLRGIEFNVPTQVDVRVNDVWCVSDEVTTWKLIPGSEVNATVFELNGGDGTFTVLTTIVGNWEFQYEIYCDGIASGEIATVSGVTQALPMALDDDTGMHNCLEEFTYDVTTNDVPCSGVTTWELVAGSEVNVIVTDTPTNGDGNFNITPQSTGPFSFNYELFCDGVSSGEVATVSGTCDCLANITAYTLSFDGSGVIGNVGNGTEENPFQAGDVVIFTLFVSNFSGYDVDGAIHSFTSLSPVTITNDPDSLSGLEIDIVNGTSQILTYTYVVTSTDASAGSFTNTASYSHPSCGGIVGSSSLELFASNFVTVPFECDGVINCPINFPVRFITNDVNNANNPYITNPTDLTDAIMNYLTQNLISATNITVDLTSCIVTFTPSEKGYATTVVEFIELCDDCPEYEFIGPQNIPQTNYTIRSDDPQSSCQNSPPLQSDLFTFVGESPWHPNACDEIWATATALPIGKCLYRARVVMSRAGASPGPASVHALSVRNNLGDNIQTLNIVQSDLPVANVRYTFDLVFDPLDILTPAAPTISVWLKLTGWDNEIIYVHEYTLGPV